MWGPCGARQHYTTRYGAALALGLVHIRLGIAYLRIAKDRKEFQYGRESERRLPYANTTQCNKETKPKIIVRVSRPTPFPHLIQLEANQKPPKAITQPTLPIGHIIFNLKQLEELEEKREEREDQPGLVEIDVKHSCISEEVN